MPSTVLLLPGWQNSGPAHWQSLWEREYGYLRVQEHDWERPLRGDWIIQLEEAVLAHPDPIYLVAHSLGCIQIAAWAAHSRNVNRVHGALLVAPPDVEREEFRPLLASWSPIVRKLLPFAAILVASSNDPFCAFTRAQSLATDWGAEFKDIGPVGHINADSGLGHWPQAHEWLLQLQQTTQTA
jgi:predicted alpha/beta hydrolase family esterase